MESTVRNDLSTISNWFAGKSETIQVIIFSALLDKTSPKISKFLLTILQNSLISDEELKQEEEEANNLFSIRNLKVQAPRVAFSKLLRLLPLVYSPVSEALSKEYQETLEFWLKFAVSNRIFLEETAEIMALTMINPALQMEKRSFKFLHNKLFEISREELIQRKESTFERLITSKDLPLPENACPQQGLPPPRKTLSWKVSLDPNKHPHQPDFAFSQPSSVEATPKEDEKHVYFNQFSSVSGHSEYSSEILSKTFCTRERINSEAVWKKFPKEFLPNEGVFMLDSVAESKNFQVNNCLKFSDDTAFSNACEKRRNESNVFLTVTSDSPFSSRSFMPPAVPFKEKSLYENSYLFSEIEIWLKCLRLHKYLNWFSFLDYEELLCINRKNFDQYFRLQPLGDRNFSNFTEGAKRKLLLQIQRLNERLPALKKLDEKLMSSNESLLLFEAINFLKDIVHTPIKRTFTFQTSDGTIPDLFFDVLSKVFHLTFCSSAVVQTKLIGPLLHLLNLAREKYAFQDFKSKIIEWKKEVEQMNLRF